MRVSSNHFLMEQIFLCILIFIGDFRGLKMRVGNLCSTLPTPFFFLPPGPFFFYKFLNILGMNARYGLVVANTLK